MGKSSDRDEFRKRHDKIGKAVNIKLEKNPDPEDKSTAYMHPTPDKVKTKHFGKPLHGWKLSQKDKAKADEIKKKKGK